MQLKLSSSFMLITSDGENHFGGMTDYHYHEQNELYFLLSGDCNYFIGNKIYNVVPGQLVIIPAFKIHKTTYRTKKRNRTLLSVKRDFLDFEPSVDITKPSIYEFSEDGEGKVVYILEKLRHELENKDALSEKMCRCLLYELFALIVRDGRETTAKQKASDTGSDSRMIEKITAYITENYMDSITLAGIAKKAGLSEGHLSRLFKNVTGLGFKEYLITVRILNAKKLLKETKLSVSRIAFDCGFNDSNYFSKLFRQYSACTPLQYRKRTEIYKDELA